MPEGVRNGDQSDYTPAELEAWFNQHQQEFVDRVLEELRHALPQDLSFVVMPDLPPEAYVQNPDFAAWCARVTGIAMRTFFQILHESGDVWPR